MTRNNFLFMLLILVFTTLAGCTQQTVDTPLYEGRPLDIGIIGDLPKIREKNIRFTEMTLDDLKVGNKLSAAVDAIFIQKEYLSEAADSKYAEVYQKAGIPFFFIESKKSYVPFIHEDLSYEELPDMSADTYATGYYQSGGKGQFWGYGLYNDQVNPSNIKDAYSRIFSTIASLPK